jgi:hypothetical protein
MREPASELDYMNICETAVELVPNSLTQSDLQTSSRSPWSIVQISHRLQHPKLQRSLLHISIRIMGMLEAIGTYHRRPRCTIHSSPDTQ